MRAPSVRAIDGDPRDDGDEPRLRRVDVGSFGPVPARPGLLHRIRGLAGIAEHAVRDAGRSGAATLGLVRAVLGRGHAGEDGPGPRV